MYCKSLIVLFPLAIVLSILLCLTASDYYFGIFKFLGSYLMNEERTGLWLRQTEQITWSFVTQLFHSGRPGHGGHRKPLEVMTRNPWFIYPIKLTIKVTAEIAGYVSCLDLHLEIDSQHRNADCLLKNMSTKQQINFVNQKLKHLNDISFREYFHLSH
jgi:hypothetical protein